MSKIATLEEIINTQNNTIKALDDQRKNYDSKLKEINLKYMEAEKLSKNENKGESKELTNLYNQLYEIKKDIKCLAVICQRLLASKSYMKEKKINITGKLESFSQFFEIKAELETTLNKPEILAEKLSQITPGLFPIIDNFKITKAVSKPFANGLIEVIKHKLEKQKDYSSELEQMEIFLKEIDKSQIEIDIINQKYISLS